MEIKPRVIIPFALAAVVAVALCFYLFMGKERTEEKPEVAVAEPAKEKAEVTLTLPVQKEPEVAVAEPPEEKLLEIPAKEEETEEVASVTPAKKEEIPAPTSSRRWAVQVNSCRSYTQAKNLQKRLRDRGLGAYITEAIIKGEKWYRVRIGFYSTRKEAVETGKKVVSEFNTKNYWPIQPSKKEIEKHFEETT
jgi:cell division protein FtsN